MTNLSINAIEKQMKKLSTEYCNAVRDDFILMFAQYAIQKFEQNGIDPLQEAMDTRFTQKYLTSYEFFGEMFSKAANAARNSNSNWSGGLSIRNHIEYMYKEEAMCFTSPDNIPYGYGQYISNKIVELMHEKEVDESKQVV